MAVVKEFYHDIDLVKVGQLLNARKHNVTTTERTALAATLGVDNEGLFVWDTDLDADFTWDGTQFVSGNLAITGDVIFKGILTTLTNPTVEKIAGYQYIVGPTAGAGTITVTGVTFQPSAVVEIGDTILFTSPTEAYVFQRNDVNATETQSGNIRLATQSEVNAGTVADEAVTPLTLQGKLVAGAYPKQYFASVSLVANTPFTVTHGLNLVDRDAFQVNVMRNNSQISVDIDSVDVNSLTLTSFLSLAGVKVTVTGASSV